MLSSAWPCRLPGGINSPEQLWEALLRGDDPVTEVPRDRRDVDEYYDAEAGVPGRSASKWGVRRRGGRVRVWRGLRGGFAQAPAGCAKGRPPDPGRGAWHGRQPRRPHREYLDTLGDPRRPRCTGGARDRGRGRPQRRSRRMARYPGGTPSSTPAAAWTPNSLCHRRPQGGRRMAGIHAGRRCRHMECREPMFTPFWSKHQNRRPKLLCPRTSQLSRAQRRRCCFTSRPPRPMSCAVPPAG